MTQEVQKACENLLYVFDDRMFVSRMRTTQKKNLYVAN